MRRGTTPTIRIKINNLPSIDLIKDIWVSFRNKGNNLIILNKTIDDLEIDAENNTVSISLTQEETLKFHISVSIQVKIYLTDEKTVCASNIIDVPINEILNPNIMGGEDNE